MASKLSLDSQKIYDKLVELLADGKKLDISIDEIKKKAGVPNANNATVSALIIREKENGNFKNLTVKNFSRGVEVGTSKYDADYKNNKKFTDFYNKTYKTPWNEIDVKTNQKANAYNAFLRGKSLLKGAKGFTLAPDEMAKKLGITLNSLRTYEAKPDESTSTRFIADNIKKKRTVGVNPTTGRRETIVRYKDPGINFFKNWNILKSSQKISDAMVDNIKEYDKVFRKALLKNKKLPLISEVIEKTSMKTPTTIANTEALYSRLLRGETFRSDVNIAKDAVLGKRIIEQLAVNSSYNSRRNAFYKLALDKVDKLYPQKSGTLKDFKNNFRTELRKIIGPNIKAVPFSVNEVISLSAGESRGVQPFSVFVDVVETNINKHELRDYQGQFSKKLKKVQKLLSGNKPNIAEAEKIALSLDSNRNTLINQLTEKGFTKAQINQLNLPDIKVGTNVLETYKAEDLARYKKSGVDIAKFAKDKGYYLDAKKAKPYFDVSVKSFQNAVLQAAKTNEGGVCNLFRAEGGRIGYAAGSNCVSQMEIAFDNDPVKLSQDINKLPEQSGAINKVKSAASKFLSIAKKGGRFGAIAAVGAAGAGLVKEFMNDDPSTYLSDENQQKNMLIDMLTEPVVHPLETPTTAFADAQLPVLGAVTAGGAIPGGAELYRQRIGSPNRQQGLGGPPKIPKARVSPFRAALGPMSGVLGKGLAATGTPLGMAALEPLFIGHQIAQGDSPTEIATNPFNYLGAAFASPLTKEATRFAPPKIASLMRMGMSPMALKGLSKFGYYGLAASLGIQGLQKYDDWRNKRGWFGEE